MHHFKGDMKAGGIHFKVACLDCGILWPICTCISAVCKVIEGNTKSHCSS